MRFFSTKPYVQLARSALPVVVLPTLLISFAGVEARLVSAEPIHLCCSMEDCAKGYSVKPNLKLAARTHLFGTILDPTLAPLSVSKVELRRWVSAKRQDSIRTVITDADGHFDAGEVEKGVYRFLPSAVTYMRQPVRLDCPNPECELQITLRATPTDTPESICPVR